MGQKSDGHGNSSKQGIDIRHEKGGLRFKVSPLGLQPAQVSNEGLTGCGAF